MAIDNFTHSLSSHQQALSKWMENDVAIMRLNVCCPLAISGASASYSHQKMLATLSQLFIFYTSLIPPLAFILLGIVTANKWHWYSLVIWDNSWNYLENWIQGRRLLSQGKSIGKGIFEPRLRRRVELECSTSVWPLLPKICFNDQHTSWRLGIITNSYHVKQNCFPFSCFGCAIIEALSACFK